MRVGWLVVPGLLVVGRVSKVELLKKVLSKILPTPNFLIAATFNDKMTTLCTTMHVEKKSFIIVYYIILLNYYTVIVMAWCNVKSGVRATNSHNMVRVSTADPPTSTAKSLLSFLFTVYFHFIIQKLNGKWSKTAQTWRRWKRKKHMHTQTHLQCRFDSAVSGLSMNSFFASQVERKSDAPYLKEKTIKLLLKNHAEKTMFDMFYLHFRCCALCKCSYYFV